MLEMRTDTVLRARIRAVASAETPHALILAFGKALERGIQHHRSWSMSPPLAGFGVDDDDIPLASNDTDSVFGFGSTCSVSVVTREGARRTIQLTLPPSVSLNDHEHGFLVDLAITAAQRAEVLERSFRNFPAGNSIQITMSEREVLNWVQDGKTNWEIATILRISNSTVKFHLSNAAKKLNANSRTQAVALAQARGLIRARTGSSRIGNMIG